MRVLPREEEIKFKMLLRSMYPFKKTHPTSISFGQGELFVELAG